MAQLFKNNATGAIYGSISDAATTITLATGHGARFPSVGSDYFLATLIGVDGNGAENAWEIVKVTARSNDVLTVVRAQEGTTAAIWASGTRIEARATAATFGSFLVATGVTPGTYSKLTVLASGLISAGAQLASGDITTALGFTPENAANKNVANGYVGLDSNTLIPAIYLPSYVDDVIEAANFAALPGTGETGKIYVTIDNGKTFRWGGSAYAEISAAPGSTDAVTEGASNLYFTTARARTSVSATGSLSYDNTTGVFSYTTPSNISTFTNDVGYITSTALNGYITAATVAATYLPLVGGSISGDVTFTGIGARIKGDFSNATVASRAMFQTSTTNGTTQVGILPNGTGVTAQMNIFGASDPTNAPYGGLLINATAVRLFSAALGSGTALPLTFYMGTNEYARLSTAGNWLIGTDTDNATDKLQVSGTVSATKYNGLTLTAASTGFTIAGGTTSKTLTVNNTITLSGTDGTTITLPATTGTVPLNNQTFYIGTTSVAINRGSGALSLTGVNIDGSAGSATTATTATKSTNLVGGNGTTLLGSIGYQSGTDTTTLLGPNTTSTKKFLSQTGTGTNGAAPAWSTVAKADVGLGSVENTALSTWAGTTNITTLGTISSGVWNGTAVPIGYGGTGAGTKTLAFNALSPLTTLGDTDYHDGTNIVRLAGNTTTTRKFIRQTGNGSASAAPAWDTLVDGDIPSALTGKTYNALTLTAASVGFTVAGGTTSKTLTVNNTISLSGTDGTTITLPATTGTVALTDQTFYIGTTSVAINRGSGSLSLTGVNIDGSAGSATTATTATKSSNLVGGNGTTLLGSIGYQSGTDTTTLLGPNTTSTKKFLAQTGTGTNGAAPAWSTLVDGDIPSSLTGKTYNALTLTAASVGFTVAGGTTSKTLTVSNTITLAGTDGTTITLPSTTGTVPLNNQTFYIGTTSVAINRGSGSLSLTGVNIDGSAGSATTATTATKSTNLAGGNGTTLLGSIGYQSGTDTTTLLGPNTTTTKLFLSQTGTGTNGAVPAWSAVAKADVGLGNVENTALSTWAGTANITTLGTIATGVWSGTAISIAKGGTGANTKTLAFNALSPQTTLGDTEYHDGTNIVRLAGNTTATRKFLRQTGNGSVSAAPAWDTLTDADIPSALTGKTYNALTLTTAATGFTIAGGTSSKTLTVNNTIALSGTDGTTLNIGAGGTLGTAAFTASSSYQAVISASGLLKGAGAGSISAATAGTDYVAPTGADGTVTRQMLKDTGFVYYDSTTTNALDYVNGSCQRWAPNTGAQTLTISNWPPTGNLGELLIQGINLGAATITWPTINWVKSDGTTTTTFASNGVTLQASGTDWVYLWTRDSGTTIYGKVVR